MPFREPTFIFGSVTSDYEMIRSKDPRDFLRVNMPLEEALKIGKLLGAQYDAVALSRDGNRSSQMIEQALISGILSTGGDVYLAGECPAPAMPFTRSGCDCYVTIAADDPDLPSGINIHNPDGSYFDPTQVQTLMSKEVRIYYPEYHALGEVHKLYGISGRYVEAVNKMFRKVDMQIVLDGLYSGPTELASRILTENGSDVVILNRTGISSAKSLMEYKNSDLLHTMAGYVGSLGAMLNNDGSMLTAFHGGREPIDKWKLAALFIDILKPTTITIPIDAPAFLDKFVSNCVVVKAEHNIKSIVDHMVSNRSEFGMDSFGRFVFSELSYTPDGIAALLMLAEYGSENSIQDFLDSVPDSGYLRERRVINASEKELMPLLEDEISATDYVSLVKMDGIRLEFDNGWILFEPNFRDSYVDITCESEDKVYAVGLMDIAFGILNAALRELD